MSLYVLFPSNVIDDVNNFSISAYSQFESKNNFPFIPIKRPYDSLNDNAIYFLGLLEDVSMLTQACERLIREAIYSSVRSRKMLNQGSPTIQPPNWGDVDRKLLKQLHLGHKYAQLKMTKSGKYRKGNADFRLAFNYNDLYAVKSLFTFGLRRPNGDENHILTTTSSPIFYFVPKMSKRINVQYYYKEGVFAPHHQSDFECYILEANSTYIIPPHTTYLIITVRQTIFSLIRCTSQVLKDFEKQPNPKFAALRIRQPKLYVPPSLLPDSTPLRPVWHPNVLLDIPTTYEVPHEDDWTLNSIFPTNPVISSTIQQDTFPRVIPEYSNQFNVSLDRSGMTDQEFRDTVNQIMNNHLKLANPIHE